MLLSLRILQKEEVVGRTWVTKVLTDFLQLRRLSMSNYQPLHNNVTRQFLLQ